MQIIITMLIISNLHMTTRVLLGENGQTFGLYRPPFVIRIEWQYIQGIFME